MNFDLFDGTVGTLHIIAGLVTFYNFQRSIFVNNLSKPPSFLSNERIKNNKIRENILFS